MPSPTTLPHNSFTATHQLKEQVLAELDLEYRPKVKRKALLISPALLALCKCVPNLSCACLVRVLVDP